MFQRNRAMLGFMASFAAALAPAFHVPMVALEPPMPERAPRSYHGKRTAYYAPNGERECARRRRQMAAKAART